MLSQTQVAESNASLFSGSKYCGDISRFFASLLIQNFYRLTFRAMNCTSSSTRGVFKLKNALNCYFLFTLALACCVSVELHAAENELVVYQVDDQRRPFFYEPSPHEKKLLRENGYAEDFYDEDIGFAGIDIFLAKRIGQEFGENISVKFMRVAGSFDEVCELVAAHDGNALGISKLSMTPDRARLVRFSTPYFRVQTLLLVGRSGQRKFGEFTEGSIGPIIYPDQELRVGIVPETAYDTIARKIVKNAKFVAIPGADLKEKVERLFNALGADGTEDINFDATIYDEIEVEYRRRQDPSLQFRTLAVPIKGRDDYFSVAVSPGAPDLLSVANVVVRQAEGRIDEFRTSAIESVPVESLGDRAVNQFTLLAAGASTVLLMLVYLFLNRRTARRTTKTNHQKDQKTIDRGSSRSWWIDIGAVAGGFIFGIYLPDVAQDYFVGAESIYVLFLATLVLPLVVCNIILSVADLTKSHTGAGITITVVSRYLLTAFAASSFGVVCAGILIFWLQSTPESYEQLAAIFSQSDTARSKELTGFWEFFASIVPSALPSLIPVVFWSVTIGIIIGRQKSDDSRWALLEPLIAVREVATVYLNLALKVLPFALFFLAAVLASVFEGFPFFAIQFFVVFCFGCLFLCIIALISICRSTGASVQSVLYSMGGAIVLATLARSSLVAVEPALAGLRRLGIHHRIVEALVPLGVTLNRQAYPLLFSMLSVFVLVMAGQQVGVVEVFKIVGVCALIGSAAVGAPIVVIGMITPGLYLAGLAPSEVMVAVSVVGTISVLVDPAASGTHLLTSSSVAASVRPKT